MKRNSIKVVIALVFLAVFNLLYFLGGTMHTSADWVSYAFIHVAYLCLLSTPLLGASVGKGLTVLVATLWLQALVYFIIEFVVGVLFLLSEVPEYTFPLVVQCILFAVFIILQLISVLANSSNAASIQKQREESAYLQEMKDKLGSKMRSIEDAALKQKIRDCYEALVDSPVESYPGAKEAEHAMYEAVESLYVAIGGGDPIAEVEKKAKSVLIAVQDRNTAIRKCRKY